MLTTSAMSSLLLVAASSLQAVTPYLYVTTNDGLYRKPIAPDSLIEKVADLPAIPEHETDASYRYGSGAAFSTERQSLFIIVNHMQGPYRRNVGFVRELGLIGNSLQPIQDYRLPGEYPQPVGVALTQGALYVANDKLIQGLTLMPSSIKGGRIAENQWETVLTAGRGQQGHEYGFLGIAADSARGILYPIADSNYDRSLFDGYILGYSTRNLPTYLVAIVKQNPQGAVAVNGQDGSLYVAQEDVVLRFAKDSPYPDSVPFLSGMGKIIGLSWGESER